MAFTCTDTSALDEAQLGPRQRADYFEPAPDPRRTCEACSQWLPKGAGKCGGCKLFAGPVHPRGTCRLFVPR